MLKKISIEQLVPGMYVERIALSWLDRPLFFFKKGKMNTREDVEALKAVGVKELYIDIAKGLDVPNQPLTVVPMPPKSPVRQPEGKRDRAPSDGGGVSLAGEMGNARRIHAEMVNFAKGLVHEARAGRMVEFERAVPLVDSVIKSVQRNANALTAITNLRSYDEYTYTHSANVSVLAVVFGQYLGLSADDLALLGVGGMFHDIGKVRIPDHILNKPGKLTEEEFAVMKNHPALGHAMLEKHANIPEPVLKMVIEHHEKYNGKGYPHGIRGENISRFGNLLSVVDVYDALTTDRVYRQAVYPSNALHILYRGKAQDFYPDLADLFVKCVGIYPIGSLVKLSSEEYGIVVDTNMQAPLEPKICVILNKKIQPLIPRILDLHEPGSVQGEPVKIVEAVDPRALKTETSELFFKSLKRL